MNQELLNSWFVFVEKSAYSFFTVLIFLVSCFEHIRLSVQMSDKINKNELTTTLGIFFKSAYTFFGCKNYYLLPGEKMLMYFKVMTLLGVIACSFLSVAASGVNYVLMHQPEVDQNKSLLNNQKIHVVTVDPKEIHSFRIVNAVGDVCSREELSTMGLRHKPTIGVSVGASRRSGRYDGCPKGLVVIDSFIRSDAGLLQPTLLIDDEVKTVEIKNQKLDWAVVIDGKLIPIDRINQPAADNEVVLYNTFFGRETRTSPQGIELVVDRGRLVQIWSSWGNAGIPRQGYVLRIGAKHQLAQTDWSQYLNKPCLSPHTKSIDLDRDGIFAVQGLCMLVEQNVVLNSYRDQFHARGASYVLADEVSSSFEKSLMLEDSLRFGVWKHTVLGITAEGLLKIIIIERDDILDGYDMIDTLDDIALISKNLGCVTAMLAAIEGDVGLWVKNAIVTKFDTTDSMERPINSALLIFEEAFEEK